MLVLAVCLVCCSDHKRHDNFVDIGICPESSVKPRRLELADMDNTDEGSIVVSSLATDSVFAARRFASALLAMAIPSVCPSVTRRYCVKTTARSTVQFALSDSKMCLVL